MDSRTDRQGDTSIHPPLCLWGYKDHICENKEKRLHLRKQREKITFVKTRGKDYISE